MAGKQQQLKWGVEKRLEFIEFRLFWEGGINRIEIMEQFGISVPQASKDLSQYQEFTKRNLEYNKSEKRYFTTKNFKPKFLKPDASQYLFQLRSMADGLITSDEAWSNDRPDFEVLPMPQRRVEPNILRAVLSAIRLNRALEIEYQSMSNANATKRWITPHAFAFDGMRWHTRAYCHNLSQFKDFLLSRILSTGNTADPGEGQSEDYVWNEFVTVVLKPHPKLSKAQSNAVEIDYGMNNKQLYVKLRLGLLYYFLKRLGLDFTEATKNPREQHVVLANPDKVKQWLDRANYI